MSSFCHAIIRQTLRHTLVRRGGQGHISPMTITTTQTATDPQDPPLVPKDIPIPPRPNAVDDADQASEQGGQSGPEPTRYGDWEKGGRCTDF
jgi:hypothetical protein